MGGFCHPGYLVACQLPRRHTSTLVTYRNKKIMIDCGEDWLDQLRAVAPDAIVITHAHPDHAFGLARGAPCPVYAIQKAWTKLKDFPVGQSNRRTLAIRRVEKIAGVRFEPFFCRPFNKGPSSGISDPGWNGCSLLRA